MKKHLLFNQSFGTVGSPNQTGKTLTPSDERAMTERKPRGEKEQLSSTCLRSASELPPFRSRYLRYAAMIFAVLVMSIGQMWGADPTWSVAVSEQASSDFLGKYKTGGGDSIIITSTATYSSGAVQIGTVATAYNQHYIEILSKDVYIDSISFKLSGNGDGKSLQSPVFGWGSAPSSNTADTYRYPASAQTSAKNNYASAVWFTYDLSSSDVKYLRLYKGTKNISSTSPSYTGTSTALGGANTIKVWGIKVWLRSSGGGCNSITPTWATEYSSTTLNVGGTSSTPSVGGNTGSGAVTFSSSDAAIASVNSSTGVVTGVGAGTATITATVAASGDYCSGTVTKSFIIKAGVTYDANSATGGSVPTDDNTYAYNTNIAVAGNTGSLYKTGFVFNGWNTRSDGTGTHYEAGATMKMPSKSTGVTLYAEWVGYATSWEWWNCGQSNNSTTFTYITSKNYICSFASSASTAVASWDIEGGEYYRGIKIKTKDHSIAFWVQTGKRVSITFGTRPTKPTFTVGGVDKSSDVGASENKDSITVTYTTTGDTKFYIENETATNTAFTVKSVKIEDAAPSCTAPNHVDVTPTAEAGNYGWRYTIGETLKLTATPYSSEGTSSPITSGITGYQWQKLVGSDWEDLSDGGTISGATTANLQISNLTSSNGGNYRCQISTGATCTTESGGYWVRIFTLNGNYYGEEWTENPIVWTGENTGVATVNLNASKTYMFKVTDNDAKWFGSGAGNYIIESGDSKDCGAGDPDIRLFTGPAGNYTFTVNVENAAGASAYVNVVTGYPTVSHPAMGYMYVSKWWDCYPHWWDGSSNALTSDGNDPKITKYTTICGTDYWYMPVLDNYTNIAVKDNATWTSASNNSGSQSTTSHSGWLLTNNGSWVWQEFTTYRISFANGGGTGSMSDITGICPNSNQAITANAFEKTGYTFGGWKANVAVTIDGVSKAAGTVIDDQETLEDIASDITLTAQWSPVQYDVTLEKGSAPAAGTSGSAKVYYDAAALTNISHATWAGHELTGYYISNSGGTKVLNADGSFAAANVSGYITDSKWTRAENTTLKAQWTCVALTVNLGGDPATPAGGSPIGTAYTLTCSASTGAIASYQWKQNTTASTEGAVNAEGTGATTASFNPVPAAAGTYYYYCVATDACGNSVNTSFSGAFQFNEPVDPCSEPTKVANEIARFFVPCGTSTAAAWSTTADASTGYNSFTTSGFGGTGNNWYTNATSGLIYGKFQSSTYIIIKLKSGSFQAGDVVTAYFNLNSGTKTGLKLKDKDSGNSFEPTASASDVETSGTYTLKAADIENDGSIKFFRTNSSTYVNRIIVTRPPVSATITATKTSPDYVSPDPNNLVLSISTTGASSGWYYRVKNTGTSGYQTPDEVAYNTSTWTMTSGLSLGENNFVVELYNGSREKQAESATITVTAETAYPITIAAGAGGSVSPSGEIKANESGNHIHPEITAIPASGYHFVNWTKNNENATLADASSATTTITNASGACTITANFAADATLYTVTFNSNGGSDVDAITQASEDASITMPAAPTNSGYTFQGWVIGGTTYAAGASYTPTANITAYASWKENCAGGGGSSTITIGDFETSKHDKSNGKPDDFAKYQYGYINPSAKTSANAVTITTSSGNSCYQNSGADFLIYYGNSIRIYANNTTTGGTPASFEDVTSVSLKIKNANSSSFSSFSIKVGETTVANAVALSAEYNSYKVYTVSGLSNLDGRITIINHGTGGTGKNFYIDDIAITTAGGGATCYYVTYDGNGAESGSVSDATAYTLRASVDIKDNTFVKSDSRFNGWNTSATGNGTSYAAGATLTIIEDITLYAQWVADACSAPSAPTISGTSIRTVGQTITLNAACASGADASTTYTWYKGVDWATASAASPVQAALTAGEGGRIFNKASCAAGDAGKYWCKASNGDGCESHNATGFTVTVNDAAGDEHIYFYKDDNHYSDGVYSDPEGNTASSGDNKSLSSPWMICNGCKAGVDSVVAYGATYDGKGNHMNAYIKLPTGGDATTKNIKFALTAGYTGTLTIKIGGYENNPTVTLQPLTAGVLGSAITPTSGTVGGVATTEDNFNAIEWPLATAGGTYVLTVTSKTGYISQIDMTTSTSATFNVTYNGNDNTGGTVPTDATNYASGATVTAAANTGDGKLVKENYTGAGWNTANNGTGTNYVPGSGTFTITANTTLYAHWTQLITLAPGTQGTGTNNAAVSWNGSVLRGFAAHTASGYALQGYYTEPSGGTKVLNADGSFAATDIDGFVTSGKWSNTGAAPTLYAQWEASNLLKWNLKVNVNETSITTLSKESAAPTVIAVANMINLTNNGSLTITGSAKSALTSKIATTASATDADAGKYMSVQFIVAAGYQLVPSDIKVKVQPISHSQTTKLILEDNNSQSISYTSGSLSKGSTHTVTMTNSEEVAFTGTVTLKIYVYGTAENDGYRLGTPIEINGSVEATCATPPTFGGLSYDATEYTVGASASAIEVTGAENVNTYAWKQNDVNDRSGGEAASGTNNAASYTPPTSTIGTKYYWCEMTNTACGITIKTPAVGITVRTATTDPTVTWSDVKLNDATATPNYGGGNYVLRATVNETSWPGTLAASMVTAPAGITIHHVTTGKADDKNYIEFKFDVTTAFDRASNATIDFNLALPEAGSYSALNSEKSVTYSDCSGGAAGQVAIKMGATASTSKSNPQNYWETAGAGRLMFNYGGNMGSTNNPSGYKTADSTFYYYAASTGQKWMFQTYIGGVNKVRVVFRAAGTIKSSKATITNFYYNTEYFASPGSNAVSFGEVSASKAGYSSGEDGYIEFTVPEMAANSYGAFVTGDGNMKVYGVVLYSENAGDGGSVETAPAWPDSKADGFTVEKNQSDANFTYTISTTTNTLGAISYSSSKPSVAAVDPVTGEVTITATGASAQSATITATLARSGCYQGATRTYTINVAGYSCSEPSGSIELTSGSATKCASESVTLTMTGFTEGADIQWYNGESTISNGGDYEIETTATRSTLTTTAAGTYSAIATKSCAAKRTNSITVANMDMSEQKTVRKVSQWYVKNGRPTPDIALWQLGEGETFKSVAWSPTNGTGLDLVTRSGIVYLEGKEPSTNTSADIPYTLTLTITDACGTDHVLSGQTITIIHQKNTDKHVLAFVVGNTEKKNNKYVAIGKGFTESITASQTTQVSLYNAIAAQFDVQATNIYSTDDEQKLREYYSQYDILCITDYPNTQTKGANSKSYVDAIGALIDIRPILTMEAFVSALPNWKLKGVSGNPKSPSTRQYTMLLQCKDHEIFSGTKLTKVGEGDEAMYRVTMVDKSQEEYKTLDANYGDGEHKANEGYQYGKKPALQGFTYTEEMSDNDMLPLGLIDDGAGNDLQVGIERQAVMEARMMVLGINSYAMERLDKDGQTVVINALKYLMKKSAEDISDCSVYFDGSDETDPTNWDNELNWGPSYASLPLPHQEVRILKECVVKDGVVARASGIKIIPRGRINHNTDDASGSLTIEPGGALIVDGKVRAAVAPNYFNATPTTPANLYIAADETKGNGTLIFDNEDGETQATVGYYSKATTDENTTWNWQYIAVPFNDNSSAYRNYYDSYLYRWAEDCSGWEEVPNRGEVYPWVGYTITQVGQKMYYMDGTLVETGEQTFTVPAGKNLVVGNSWTAPIQVKQFTDDDFAHMSKNVYLFNTGYDPDGEGSFSGTRYEGGTYVTIPIHSSTYTGDSLISSLQAFIVYAKTGEGGGTFTLDYDRHIRPARTTDNLSAGEMHAPKRGGVINDKPAVLKVWASGSRYDDRLVVLEREDFSTGLDEGWDGNKRVAGNSSPLIFAVTDNGREAVSAIPTMEGTLIGFWAGEDNEYTLHFEYDEEDELYLLDLDNNTYTPVNSSSTYVFTVPDKKAHNRFILTYNAPDPVATGVEETQANEKPEAKAIKFLKDEKVFIFVNGKLYDATGKVVK